MLNSDQTRSAIDPGARIGAVHLTIADLETSLRFYQERLGFTVHGREDQTAAIGAGGADLLVLTQSESAARTRGTTGLYHFAVLVPSRSELARSLRHLVATGTELQGAADHGVSESLYLADPDGNGIEIYRDRLRGEWPSVNGQLRMTIDPLDLDSLLADEVGVISDHTLAPQTVIGHVHLRVSNLPDTERFYAGALGFDVMQRYGPGALFVAAGGYHHHLGLNTWAGVGAPSPPPGAIGLRHFEVVLPDEAAVARVERRLMEHGVPVERADGTLLLNDPSRNAIAIKHQL